MCTCNTDQLSQLFSLHGLNLNQELPLLKIVHIFSGSWCVKSALYTVQSFQSFNGNYMYVKLYPVGHVLDTNELSMSHDVKVYTRKLFASYFHHLSQRPVPLTC